MKVILLAVTMMYYHNNSEFLGLELLKSSLEHNNIDCEIIKYEFKETKEISTDNFWKSVNWSDVLFVGLSPSYATIDATNIICNEIKSVAPYTKLVVGGAAVSHAVKETFEYMKNIDIIIIGEGEKTVVELFKKLISNNIDDCRGIAYKKNQLIITNDSMPLIENLDEIPWASRTMINDYNIQSIRMQTARGCEGSCTFCAESRVFEKDKVKCWRGRSPQNVVDEMEKIINDYGITNFSFVDESFEDPISTFGEDRLVEFSEEILKRNLKIHFECLMRADSIQKISKKVFEKLKKAGLISVLIGIESGSEKALKCYGKKATVKQNIEAYNFLLKELKINVIAGFIMFNPYTDLNEIKENINFIKKIGIQYSYRIFTNQVALFIDTPLYDRTMKDGLLKNYSLANPYGYTFVHNNTALICCKVRKIFGKVEELSDATRVVDYFHQVFINLLKSKEQLDINLYNELVENANEIKMILGQANLSLFEEIVFNPEQNEVYFEKNIKMLIQANKEALLKCNRIQKRILSF